MGGSCAELGSGVTNDFLAGRMRFITCFLFCQVHNNVANFGGDPDNVTAFGVSAGALVIGNLLIYDRSILFQRAILLSAAAGTGVSPMPCDPFRRLQLTDSLIGRKDHPSYRVGISYLGSCAGRDWRSLR